MSKDIFLAVYEKLYPGGGKGEDFCKYTFATFDRDNIGTSKNKLNYHFYFAFIKVEFHEFMLAIGLRQSNDLDLRYGIAFDIHNYNCSETSKDFLNLFSFCLKKKGFAFLVDANELAKAISVSLMIRFN
jgi:hypothetical protein